MKWRHSIVYLVVLLLAGGYFYYFEVVKTREKEAAVKQAEKVFQLKSDAIQAMEIHVRKRPPVKLSKETHWKIVEPVPADVDDLALEGVLDTLAGLTKERTIAETAEDLAPYGLLEPSVRVRFKAGDSWTDLLLGERNPLQDAYYARVEGRPQVFLVSEGSGDSLNKGLDDLRKKSLFAFKPEEVRKLEVSWKTGETLAVERPAGSQDWKIKGHEEVKVKAGKVRNVLEQIQWLRADTFLENETVGLASHGLEPPRVKVRLQLENDQVVELLLSDVQGKNSDRVAAAGSQVRGIVELPSSILQDLPVHFAALEDRSLLGMRRDEVRQVEWSLGERRGHVTAAEKDQWKFKSDGVEGENLKEPWRVQAVLWELNDSEYSEKISPMPPLPESPYGRLSFWDKDRKRTTLTWEKPDEANTEPVCVWLEKDGAMMAVRVKAGRIATLQRELEAIPMPSEQSAP
jgi:hypothetical protein